MARNDEGKVEDLPAPLYRGAVDHLRGLDPLQGNGGLWFDKFCNTWNSQPSKNVGKWQGCKVDKNKWLDLFADIVGDEPQLKAFAERRSLLLNALGGMLIELATESRFVTGLGRQHPIENGFAWHQTLGVPYLPGSSVKGLVRAWVESGLGEKAGSDADRILGRVESSQGGLGSVIFFEAIPTCRVRLEKDVMTPHYGPYYQKGVAPGDWLAPTPIPFLAVALGQRFTFAVAASSGGRANPRLKDCDTALEWLQAALTWLGAGAKTAVGYGRFMKIEKNHSSTTSTDEPRLQNPLPKLDAPRVSGGPATATPPSRTAAVRVQVIGLHEKLGKSCFFVKEEGKARGILKYGKPPEKLPESEEWIEVYRTNDNPQSPEYRWDKPETPRQQATGKRPPRGGRR
jgi:CRISPR-associated protein Cmr6